FAGTPPDMPTKEKKLYLTVYLQGFFDATDMHKVIADATGPVYQWPGAIVDTITVELHDATNYANIVYTAYGVNLNQDGTANSGSKTYVSIPSSYNGDYRITVKSRNHVETTTAASVPFNTASITYNFTTAATQAYGSNMKESTAGSGIFVLYVGDVNQDGAIEPLTDLAAVKAAINTYTGGYIPVDVNGDGVVEPLTDYAIVKAAINTYVTATLP
ncbi:MAG: dockerin type I domain-containing protein, partial [Bacteroidales bacterium]